MLNCNLYVFCNKYLNLKKKLRYLNEQHKSLSTKKKRLTYPNFLFPHRGKENASPYRNEQHSAVPRQPPYGGPSLHPEGDIATHFP